MNRITCDVIKDLIPSYLDGICSEASKELVEIHISECTDCRELLKEMQETEFITQKSDIEQINHMRKVKFAFAKRNIVIVGILFAFVIAGMLMIMSQYGSVPTEVYYVVLPVGMSVVYLVQSDYSIVRRREKDIKWFCCLGILGLFYVIGLQSICIYWCYSGNYPVWIPMHRLGPFCYIQFMILVLLEFGICIGSLVAAAKREQSYGIIPYISMMDAVLCLVCISIMKNMADVENYMQEVCVPFAIIVIESTIVVGSSYWKQRSISQLKDKNMDKEAGL